MSQRLSGDRSAITTGEAGKIANMSRQHINRLLTSGRIEGVKLGHDWLVYEDSLQAFLAQPRKPGPKGVRKKPTSSHLNDGNPATEQVNTTENKHNVGNS